MTQVRDGATRVKVCGITCPADLRVAIEAGADAIGLLVGFIVLTVVVHFIRKSAKPA